MNPDSVLLLRYGILLRGRSFKVEKGSVLQNTE